MIDAESSHSTAFRNSDGAGEELQHELIDRVLRLCSALCEEQCVRLLEIVDYGLIHPSLAADFRNRSGILMRDD